MAAGLMRPLIAGAGSGSESLSTIMARAQQQATAQSAQILAAANNISRSRDRAAQAAQDATFRLRAEAFAREQFQQKRHIEEARLAIDQARESRSVELHPGELTSQRLRNKLTEVQIEQAPLRTAMLGAQVTGANLLNTQRAAELEYFPGQLETDRQTREARLGLTQNALTESNDQMAFSDEVYYASNEIQHMLSEFPNNKPEENFEILRGFKEDSLRLLKDPDLAEMYEHAVNVLNLPDAMREQLSLQRGLPPVQPGFVETGRQESVSADGRRTVQRQVERLEDNTRLTPADVARKIANVNAQGKQDKEKWNRQLKILQDRLDDQIKLLSEKPKDQELRADVKKTREAIDTTTGQLDKLDKKISQEIEKIRLEARPKPQDSNNLPVVPGMNASRTRILLGDPDAFAEQELDIPR